MDRKDVVSVTRIRFAQVDAFADRPFAGNPAAVMPMDVFLEDVLLQAIAEENNLAETAFYIPDSSGAADYELRWFTPTVEVALCGHATLATGHIVLSENPAMDRVTFRTRRSGILWVERAEQGYRMALPAYYGQVREMPELIDALGLKPEQVDEVIWHSDGHAVVAVKDEATLHSLTPDIRAVAAEVPVMAIVTAAGSGSDVVSRVFAPGAGIDEDSVTGSAHSFLIPYWADRLGRRRFTAYQASPRGGHIGCERIGDEEGEQVILSGQCVTVIEGSFLL